MRRNSILARESPGKGRNQTDTIPVAARARGVGQMNRIGHIDMAKVALVARMIKMLPDKKSGAWDLTIRTVLHGILHIRTGGIELVEQT